MAWAKDEQPSRIELEPDLRADVKAALSSNLDVPELRVRSNDGHSALRDVLADGNDIFVATGDGILKYTVGQAAMTRTAEYRESSGLPSDNVFLLRKDARGGIWCMCEGGIGYRSGKSDKWVSYTQDRGLSLGTLTSLTTSSDGNCIWATGTGGVATTSIDRMIWRVYTARNLIDAFPCPDGRWVWCRRLISTHEGEGRDVITEQLDLTTGKWSYVPGSDGCPGNVVVPVMWCRRTHALWLAGESYYAPVVYDPNTGKSTTWTMYPLWMPQEARSVVNIVDLDWFGDRVVCEKDGEQVWCATRVGVWVYQTTTGKWIGYRCREKPSGGTPVFCMSNDGKLLYWACDGNIAVFDVRRRQFAGVWYYAEEKVGDPHWIAPSPDGRSVWVIADRGTVIRDLPGRVNSYITKGMSSVTCVPTKVTFVPSVKRVVVYGLEGGVICDYSGKILYPMGK
jgi:hypothetical protein